MSIQRILNQAESVAADGFLPPTVEGGEVDRSMEGPLLDDVSGWVGDVALTTFCLGHGLGPAAIKRARDERFDPEGSGDVGAALAELVAAAAGQEVFSRVQADIRAVDPGLSLSPYAINTVRQPGYRPQEIELPLRARGFTEGEIDELYSAWSSYDALRIVRSEYRGSYDGLGSVPEPDEWMHIQERSQAIAQAQAAKVQREVRALLAYEERHGLDELRQVRSIFTIHHFDRYVDPDDMYGSLLHGQLERWQDPDYRPSRLVHSSTSDWNGAFTSPVTRVTSAYAGYTAHERVANPDQTLFFEVDSMQSWLANMKSVGNRERAYGRDPSVGAFVDDSILFAHGNPEVVALLHGNMTPGAIRQHAELLEQVHKDIGPALHILNTCAPGGITTRLSILQALQQADLEVVGSPDNVIGIRRYPNGQVTFLTE